MRKPTDASRPRAGDGCAEALAPQSGPEWAAGLKVDGSGLKTDVLVDRQERRVTEISKSLSSLLGSGESPCVVSASRSLS